MKNDRRRGFTLIEIVIVIGIASVIFTAGIAPLLFTVRALSDERTRYTENDRERIACIRIFQDMSSAASENRSDPIRVQTHEELSEKKSEVLAVWSRSPVHQGSPVSNVVYAIPEQKLGGGRAPGLHRWIISVDITSSTMLEEMLDAERSQLLIPGLKGFSVLALRDGEWREHYTGSIPTAVKILLEYEDDEKSYEYWFPNAGS